MDMCYILIEKKGFNLRELKKLPRDNKNLIKLKKYFYNEINSKVYYSYYIWDTYLREEYRL